MSDEHVYSFGDDDDTLLSRLIAFLVGEGMVVELIGSILSDPDKGMKFRQFVYEEDELRSSLHKWFKDSLGWPVQYGEDQFWNTKFAKWYTPKNQCDIMKEWFAVSVAPQLEHKESD